jgi:Rrf2 family nitric oxide-sensitive transcriptional repressor
MKINAFSDVCLRIVMLLAARPEQQLPTRDIAEGIGVPYNQVSKAVLKLGQLGRIDVTRGRAGGVRINEAGLGMGAGTLLRELDDHEDVVDCTTADGRNCPLIAGCRLRVAFRQAREAFYAELDKSTIRELAGSPALVRLPLPFVR